MKRKLLVTAVMVMTLMLSACGTSPEENGAREDGSVAASQSTTKAEEKKEEYVTVILPASLTGEDTTQEELDRVAEEKGFKSATLNGDGSTSYVMTRKTHDKIMEGVRETINEALAEMPLSESYPQITAVTANEDYTVFTVITKNDEPSLAESFGTMALYAYGAMYNHYNATPVDNVHVDFVNADSGQVIASADSKNLGD